MDLLRWLSSVEMRIVHNGCSVRMEGDQPERTMDVELCPKCRSWRVTETTLEELTRYICQECTFTWSVSAADGFEPRPAVPGTGNTNEDSH